MGALGSSLAECSVRDDKEGAPGRLDARSARAEPLLSQERKAPGFAAEQPEPRLLEEGRGEARGSVQAAAGAIREGLGELVQEEKEEVREVRAKAWTFLRKLRWQLLGVILYFVAGGLYYGRVCGWSFVDCAYFAAAVVTTVGYGDIVPPQEDGPVLFTCCYIVFALVIIATTISTVLDEVMSGQLLAAMEALEAQQNESVRNMLKQTSDGNDDSMIFSEGSDDEAGKRWAKKYVPLIRACASGLVCLVGGTVGYMVLEPDDDAADAKLTPWVRALYFSITTLTTVGFGDILVKTDEGKAFDIAFMIVGIPIFGNLLATLMTFFAAEESSPVQALVQVKELDSSKMRDLLSFEEELHSACAGKLSDGKRGEIDCQEYMSFILVRNGVIKMETIKEIVHSFNKLDKDGSGVINTADISSLGGQGRRGSYPGPS